MDNHEKIEAMNPLSWEEVKKMNFDSKEEKQNFEYDFLRNTQKNRKLTRKERRFLTKIEKDLIGRASIGERIFIVFGSIVLIGTFGLYAHVGYNAFFYYSQGEVKSEQAEIIPTPPTLIEEVPATVEQEILSEDKDDLTKPENKYYIKVNYDGLNIRKEPTTNSNSLGKLGLYEELEVIQYEENEEWIEVYYQAEPAYVHSDYVQVLLKETSGDSGESEQ